MHGEGAWPGTTALQSPIITDCHRISRLGRDAQGPSQSSCLDKSLSQSVVLPWGETGPGFPSEGAKESYERFVTESRRKGGEGTSTAVISTLAPTEPRVG